MTLPIRRALISVSDKTGLTEFARALAAFNIEIVSTGGTAKSLHAAGIPAVDVASVTGFPEIMDGRVKTLHPKIHGGLLAVRNDAAHDSAKQAYAIADIDLLVVNLYPFEETVAKQADWNTTIENIDVGGPAMLRAAAKNHDRVTVVVSPDDYAAVVSELKSHGGNTTEATRRLLAAKAFARTAAYDAAIAQWFSKELGDTTPGYFAIGGKRLQTLRYGENPHQTAALYRDARPAAGTLANYRQLQGKELSYNNIADADAAWECVKSFEAPACVIVKHANPCGVAVAQDIETAYERAYQTDPTSAFGGIIAFNRAVDRATVDAIVGRQFVELLIAPDIEEGALQAARAKANMRVLQIASGDGRNTHDTKRIGSGLLIQTADNRTISRDELKVVTRRVPSEQQINDLLFAWRVVKFVKSNAIVYAREERTVGIGAGQMSRIYSAKLAAIKAADEGLQVAGAVMASDAFFPFRDGIDAAFEAGIAAIVQPGGSQRDDEVIAAADAHGMAMVFTGVRHFRH